MSKLLKGIIWWRYSLVLLVVICTGCSNTNQSSQTSKEPNDSHWVEYDPSMQIDANLCFSSLSLDTEKRLNIVFIGNSLTKVGEIPKQFSEIAQLCNVTVNVNTIVHNGYHLYEHIDELKENVEELRYLKEADVVVFQEYGAYTETTVNDLQILMGMASKEAYFLYMLTEFDTDPALQREKQLSTIEGLTMIPTGYVHDTLLKGLYQYEYLHQVNDYHPNFLYGYISALTIYATLFDETLMNITYDLVPIEVKVFLKSKTKSEQEQKEEFRLIKETICLLFLRMQE